MTTPVGGPNYAQLTRNQGGVEVIRGTAVAATNKWYGKLALQPHRPIADSEDYAGDFFADHTPVRGALSVDGTYNQQLAYEDAFLFRYGMKGGITPADDGNTVHGYTYTFRHTATRDDLDTTSREYGDPIMIYACNGLFFPEMTISSDIDDAQASWKLATRVAALSLDRKAGLDDVAATSGSTTTFVKTGWAQTIDALIGQFVHFKTGTAGNIGLFREILDNDATSITFAALPSAVQAADTIDVYAGFTAGISDRTREKIAGPGTKLYLDTVGGTIGTTEITGRFISFSITETIEAGYKRFFDNVNTMSNRMDRGPIKVRGQVRLEMDRRREWDKYTAMTPEKMRIRQTGSALNSSPATTKVATIDVYNLVWDDPAFDQRGNNNTATWSFWGFVGASEAVPMEIAIKHGGATLLA